MQEGRMKVNGGQEEGSKEGRQECSGMKGQE